MLKLARRKPDPHGSCRIASIYGYQYFVVVNVVDIVFVLSTPLLDGAASSFVCLTVLRRETSSKPFCNTVNV